MKVYTVMPGWLDEYSVIVRRIEGIFSSREKAEAFAAAFTDEHCIEDDNLYMVPKSIYEEYQSLMCNNPGLKVESYKGFAPRDFDEQSRRCEIYSQNWVPPIVDEWEVL